MTKLIGLDGKVLSDLYNEGVAAVRCTLWRPDVRHKAIYDRLKLQGVSLTGINFRLYTLGIPRELGRLPELLNIEITGSDVINIMHYLIDEFSKDKRFRELSGDKRTRHLTRYIALGIADSLAYDPETFSRYKIAG